MQHVMDRWIRRYLAKLRFGLFLEHAARWLAGFLFVFGSAVLAVKLLLPAFWPGVLWLATAIGPVLLGAWVWSRRNGYTRSESVALLDRKLETGGLLMTLDELEDGRWNETLPQTEKLWRESLPRIRPVRFATSLVLPCVFVLGTCFVPVREARTEPILHNTVGRDAAEELETMLESLDEQDVLEEQEEKQLREEIRKLAEESKDQPLTHEKWETVDALRERMKTRMDGSLRNAAKARDAVRTLAEAARTEGTELSAERRMQLESDAIESLRRLSASGEFADLSGETAKRMKQLAKRGRFPKNAAERQKMLNELSQHLDREFKKLAELRKQASGKRKGACKKCGGPAPGGT